MLESFCSQFFFGCFCWCIELNVQRAKSFYDKRNARGCYSAFVIHKYLSEGVEQGCRMWVIVWGCSLSSAWITIELTIIHVSLRLCKQFVRKIIVAEVFALLLGNFRRHFDVTASIHCVCDHASVCLGVEYSPKTEVKCETIANRLSNGMANHSFVVT